MLKIAAYIPINHYSERAAPVKPMDFWEGVYNSISSKGNFFNSVE
jgi:hypothetical protein